MSQTKSLTEPEEKALKALTYIYDRARRECPDLMYEIGDLTQTLALTAQAIAALTGRDEEEVREELTLPLVPRHHDPIPRVRALSEEVDFLRELLDDDGRLEARRHMEDWRRHEEAEYRGFQRGRGVQ